MAYGAEYEGAGWALDRRVVRAAGGVIMFSKAR